MILYYNNFMQRNSKLQNEIARFFGAVGLFWTMVSPVLCLGIPFLVIGLILSIKNKDTSDGLANILFNSISIILVIFYMIFVLIANFK